MLNTLQTDIGKAFMIINQWIKVVVVIISIIAIISKRTPLYYEMKSIPVSACSVIGILTVSSPAMKFTISFPTKSLPPRRRFGVISTLITTWNISY